MLGAERNGFVVCFRRRDSAVCRTVTVQTAGWITDDLVAIPAAINRHIMFSRGSRPDKAPTLPIGRSFYSGKAAKA